MSKKKVLIYGSGLTSLIIKTPFKDQYELYENPKKIFRLIHPHVFSPVF